VIHSSAREGGIGDGTAGVRYEGIGVLMYAGAKFGGNRLAPYKKSFVDRSHPAGGGGPVLKNEDGTKKSHADDAGGTVEAKAKESEDECWEGPLREKRQGSKTDNPSGGEG